LSEFCRNLWLNIDVERLCLGWAVDQSLARQSDHLGRNRGKLVDRDDAFDLGKQTLDQPKVAAGDASDRIDDGG
jgi:hypothetical protein